LAGGRGDVVIRCGNVLVLNYDDVVEGLLDGAMLSIPEGATRLMLKCDARDRLNVDLGYSDAPDDEEEP
jgi:hypothetical protein